MPTIEEMTLDEIDAAMAKLRERRSSLKKTGKVADRKILTLERRRARLMDQVHAIDEQIAELRREASITPAPAPKKRGRRPKSATLTM
ncbi:MAG TPA: hypothetical protein VHV83_13245 [Armatimonadota bacterium]|jgi:chromosome segregation ATPase|nr:hypothetical protein [Armatimonadota bacterium]